MKMAITNTYRAIDTHMSKPTNVETNRRRKENQSGT